MPDPTSAPRESAARPSVRLSLKPAEADLGLLDGAWWPHSRDLTHELPALTDILDHRWARITRVAVNPTFWPVVPKKVAVTRHVVHVGWFMEQDRHKLLLLSYTEGRWDLLVVPPESSESAAARLMAAAADPHNRLTADALVVNEKALGTAEFPQSQDQAWRIGGGTTSPSHG
ncbi:DUF5994 family protein [Streptomyces olivoreticuli]